MITIFHSQYRTEYLSLVNFSKLILPKDQVTYKIDEQATVQIKDENQQLLANNFLDSALYLNQLALNSGSRFAQNNEGLIKNVIEKLHEPVLNSIQSKKQTEILVQEKDLLEIFSDKPKGEITLINLIIYEILYLILQIDGKSITEQFSLFMGEIETNSEFNTILYSKENLQIQQYLRGISNKELEFYNYLAKYQDNFRFFAQLNGCMKVGYPDIDNLGKDTPISQFLPVSLLPMKIKKDQIEDLLDKQIIWQQILNDMASDIEWIESIFSDVQDEFVNRFLNILKKVKTSETASKYNYTIMRNDFMHHFKNDSWLQVEYNTLSSGLVHISDTVQEVQQTLSKSYIRDQMKDYDYYSQQNKELAGESFVAAHELYGKKEAVVLYVVGKNEWNMYDQRHSELHLANNGIIAIRKTFEELLQEAKFEQDGTFLVGDKEVAVVYWRWGYNPKQYYSEQIWDLREKIELTKAIKCPNVQLLLVNFKKVQLEMQTTDILNKYIQDKQIVEKIKSNFAIIHDFNDEQKNNQLLEEVHNNPDDWVLKPQREGGGNNIFGRQIYESLKDMDINEKKNYILMQKIKPRPRTGYMLQPNDFILSAVISELSCWGYFIGDQKKIVKNVKGGYLIRTKVFNENEGGLAVQLSVLDGLMVPKQN